MQIEQLRFGNQGLLGSLSVDLEIKPLFWRQVVTIGGFHRDWVFDALSVARKSVVDVVPICCSLGHGTWRFSRSGRAPVEAALARKERTEAQERRRSCSKG